MKNYIPAGFEPVNHRDMNTIIGRLHVGTSPLAVARRAKQALVWETTPRAHRRYAIAAALQAHARNIWEYRYVMGSVPRKFPAFQPRYFFNRETLKTIIVKPTSNPQNTIQ